MKKFLLVASLACACVAVPAHADITIGLAAPLTGSNAAFGEQLKRGYEQAIADINAKGGVRGEKLALKESDDACDPKQAVTVANQMISSGVKFVVGHACSSASIPASKVYAEDNVLMMTPFSTNPALTEAGLNNVFRTCGRDDQQASVQANYILKHFAGKKIAIIHDNSTAGRGQAELFRKTLNAAGVKEVMFDAYTPGEKDYSALVSKLKQVGAEVLDIGGYYTEAGLIARQLKQQNATIQVMGGDALATDEFWGIAGNGGEGVLMSFEPDARKYPEAAAAIDSIRKGGYEPKGYTLYTYAAVQALAEGIERAGKADPVKVAAALRAGGPVTTVIGKIGFDAKGDVTGSSYVIYRWHDGKYAETGE